MVAAKRMSNVELLRIVAMLMIIFCHDVMASGLPVADYASMMSVGNPAITYINAFWGRLAYMLGPWGAAVFFIITGYFLNRENVRWRGIRQIALLFSFYMLIKYFLETYAPWLWRSPFGPEPEGVLHSAWFLGIYFLIMCVLPWLKHFLSDIVLKGILTIACIYGIYASHIQGFWFISDYLIVLLLFPVVCKGFFWLNNKARMCLLLAFFVETLLISAHYYDGSFLPPSVVSMLNIWVYAYAYLTPFFLCLLGAVMRDAGIAERRNWRTACLFIWGMMLIALLYLEFSCMNAPDIAKFARLAIFGSPLSWIMSVFLFLCFLWAKMPYMPVVNRYAGMVLAVYIIHVSPQLNKIWWGGIMSNANSLGRWYLLLSVLIQSVLVLLGCFLAEHGRQKLFAWCGDKIAPLRGRFSKAEWL